MNTFVVLFVFATIFVECHLQHFHKNLKTTIEIIKSFGYPVEVHTVETKDGYLLQMHRIPPRVTNGTNPEIEKRRKFPIVYANSLFGSSAEIVLPGPRRSLPFLLSDLGFDIWLGNVRGNSYSRAHKYLSPNDKRFWDFSWHESGVYDLPAEIDYVLNVTKREKVILIGFSMGGTSYFVMASTLPEYNHKIEMAFTMGSPAHMTNVNSPFLKILIPFFKIRKFAEDLFGNGELYRRSQFMESFLRFMCTLSRLQKKYCENFVFLLGGADPEGFDKDLLAYYLTFYPDGYSIKGANHYAQLMQSGGFRQYDHGPIKNLQRYNSLTPPHYNVSAITAKTYLYVGPNDYLGNPTDSVLLARQIPGLKKFHMVNHPKFNHFDFLIGVHAKELVYDLIIQDIETHLNELTGNKTL